MSGIDLSKLFPQAVYKMNTDFSGLLDKSALGRHFVDAQQAVCADPALGALQVPAACKAIKDVIAARSHR